MIRKEFLQCRDCKKCAAARGSSRNSERFQAPPLKPILLVITHAQPFGRRLAFCSMSNDEGAVSHVVVARPSARAASWHTLQNISVDHPPRAYASTVRPARLIHRNRRHVRRWPVGHDAPKPGAGDQVPARRLTGGSGRSLIPQQQSRARISSRRIRRARRAQ